MKNHKNLAQYQTVIPTQQPTSLGGDAQNQCHSSTKEAIELIPISLPVEAQINRGVPVGPEKANVLSGHGCESNRNFIIPGGTHLRLPHLSPYNDVMSDEDGYYIEVNGKAPPHIKMDNYGPGATAPDHVLSPGPDLTIAETSTTVTAPTYLSDILLPNMGVCYWAACRVKDESEASATAFKCAA